MGTFFCRFATFLQAQGKTVKKINFNAGDAFFYCHKQHAIAYRGKLDEFHDFLKVVVEQHKIDAIVCFNDCRPYHAVAKTLCHAMGVSFFVFEEGYLRPDYITLQEHGINGYSQLDLKAINKLKTAQDTPLCTKNRFWRLCVSSAIYYGATFVGSYAYPHYRHYRGLSIFEEACAWATAPIRKALGYLPDKYLQKQLIKHARQSPYFVVTLQVHNDSQISHHSDYTDVREFIAEVIQSFATHAPKHTRLVFKHHPLDRGHRNYQKDITKLSVQWDVVGRVFYGCDMHLPSLLKLCKGMITINSTTALQAVYHKKPTKITGRALYNIEGLADMQSLDSFWVNPTAPNHAFYLRFREYLIEQTQLNGSFYGKAPWELPSNTR